ncbi:MAG: paraquat-inducible protein A [Cyclobacteriaceae bacterium]
MRTFRSIGLTILLLSTIILSFFIWKSEAQKRMLKQDIIELSKVKYGLFNVDEWKSILAEIISKKIDQFNFNRENRDEMEVKVSDFLHKAINEFEQNFKQTNRKQSWFGISYKNVIANSVSLFTRLRENVPELTNQIITYLDDPGNRQSLKQYINKKIGEYADETFSQIDYSHLNSILTAHNYENRIEALDGLQQQIRTLDKQSKIFRYSLIAFILIQTLALIVFRKLSKLETTVFTGLAFTLLCLGLSLPMIDIDARISEMSFTLLGENIRFTDQVLYFKSKSILEVVSMMFQQGKIDLALVGVLVLLFSVIFPISKLVCTLLYTYKQKLRDATWINFIVFRTGKWSMADVMVVTIFMAYIGFSGIITEQLKQLESIASSFDILTTNQSTLQLGFYMFTCFVVISLLISQRIQDSRVIPS